jgi:hypothetical protein
MFRFFRCPYNPLQIGMRKELKEFTVKTALEGLQGCLNETIAAVHSH